MGKRRIPTVSGSDPSLGRNLGHEFAEHQLDLHGYRVQEATFKATSFLHRIHATHPGSIVRIIVGRGMNSATGPQLRPAVRRVLQEATEVDEWAPSPDGGSFIVRLKGGGT